MSYLFLFLRKGTITTELVFTGTPGERPSPIRRNTYTKVEGEFIDSTTTRSEYVDHRTVERAEIVKRTDNLTVGEGEFTVGGGKGDKIDKIDKIARVEEKVGFKEGLTISL